MYAESLIGKVQLWAKIGLFMSIFLSGMVLEAYGGWHDFVKTPVKRSIIVLLDETESFAQYQDGSITTMFWNEVLPYICAIIRKIQPENLFGMIGIDEKGFETTSDDVRILQALPMSSGRTRLMKKTIEKMVASLQRRKEQHKTTDILGALEHAESLLTTPQLNQDTQIEENQQQQVEYVIFIFSDMKQEPKMPTLQMAKNLKFPENTKIYCFYVNASGRQDWDKITKLWGSIFKQAGVKTYHFYQRQQTKIKLGEIIASWSKY